MRRPGGDSLHRPRHVLVQDRLLVIECSRQHDRAFRVAGVPGTTAALRFSPRSFARFIGEPLNSRENSS